jgi:hypothetical protein
MMRNQQPTRASTLVAKSLLPAVVTQPTPAQDHLEEQSSGSSNNIIIIK